LIEILYDAPDPIEAADVANAIAQEYLIREQELRSSTSAGTNDYLNTQLEDLRSKLQTSEQNLLAYARAANLTFASEKTNGEEEKLHQLRAELTRAESDRVQRQATYETALSSPQDTLPEIVDNQVLHQYQLKATDLRRELAELESTLTPAHY